MAAKTLTGGGGTQTNPFFSSAPAHKTYWQYFYNPGSTYRNMHGAFVPSADEIEAGFLHMDGSSWYRTTSQLSGIKLIAANIKTIEKRMAADQKDLDGLLAAQKLLTDNPEWTTLLELHNRGLL